MGVPQSNLQKRAVKVEKGVSSVKTCIRSTATDEYECGNRHSAYYHKEPVRRVVAVQERIRAHPSVLGPGLSTNTNSYCSSESAATSSSAPSAGSVSPISSASNSTGASSCRNSTFREGDHRQLPSSSSVRDDSPIVSWLSDVNRSRSSRSKAEKSLHLREQQQSWSDSTNLPPPTVGDLLHHSDVTAHFRHLHHHQGRLAMAAAAAGPRSASVGSMGSLGAHRPLQASWSKLETDLEYYGMILLDKILEQEPQACYLLTFVRHTDINQLLSDLRLQRILAIRIMETVGLMVECAEDWKTAEPVLSSLVRRHNVSTQELRYHIQVINNSLFTMLHAALGADWTAEMATAWRCLLAKVCNTLFHPTGSQSSCHSPTTTTSSSNNLAWTSVKWKAADYKDVNRRQSNSPLPFKSLDDISRSRQSPPRSSPLSRLPSLRLTRTTSSSPTKEHVSRKSSSSSTSTSGSNPPLKSPLQRSWSSR